MWRIDFYAMGCHMSASVDSDSAAAQEALKRLPGLFEGWERRLSRFHPDSELNQLNGAEAGWQRVSRLLYEHLVFAQRAAQFSQGYFDPTMLAQLEALGYDRSFELIDSSESEPLPAASMPGAGWNLLSFDPEGHRVKLPAGLRLDLGGISKAVAAEQAAAKLARLAPVLVDGGGDIAISGPRRSGEPWPIAVGSPFEPERDLGWLWMERGVAATSGRDYRRWLAGGKPVHHLIDPRTGLSAETDVLAVTVVAPYAWQAEAGAKAALIQGSRNGLDWLQHKEELEGLMITEQGEVLETKGLVRYGWTG